MGFVKIIIGISFFIFLISLGFVSPVAGTPPPPKYDGTIGVVTIGFDHGFYSQWQPMMYLSSQNFSGTVYVVTNRTPQQNPNLFPWSNLHTLYGLGYEMASHSRLHLVETSGLSNATLYSEIYGSKVDLQNQGFNVCGYVIPSSGNNATTRAVINKFYNYSSANGINPNTLFSIAQSKNTNGMPYLLIMGTGDLDPTQLGYLTNFTQTKAQIDKAIQTKAFLHIHFHDIVNSTSDYQGLQYPVSFSWYKQTIDYIKQKSDQGVLKVETLSQAMGYGKQCEIVTDKTPPSVSVPSSIALQIKSTSVKVNYTATASDNVGLLNGPTCNPVSGSVFSQGNTTVTCTANDWAGNIGTKSFVVSVKQDTTPPTVTVPANIVAAATSLSGAQVNYTVTATDDVGVTSGPTCNPDSGSVFPIGNTTVTCTTSDAVGNVGTNSFKISVTDTVPPIVNVPANIITQATSSSGALVNYVANATDNIGVTSGPTCNPASGTIFPLGNTTVTCTASDAANNVGSNSFTLTVNNDVSPPVVTVPADIILQATSSSGAQVNFTTIAADDVGVTSGPTCNPASGAIFPLGNTTVTCTASDGVGNVGTSFFRVSVKDTTPPVVSVPASVKVSTPSPAGIKINYTTVATDNVGVTSGPTCNPDSGTIFPLGNTTVTCTASDAANNVGSNSFIITVINDVSSPVVAVPADIILQATSSSGAQVNYTVTATDDVGVTSGPTCNPDSGSVFPIGNTTITCTASDAANNVGTNSFKISVKDTTSPSITVPANIVAAATSSSGAQVNYTATATDNVGVTSGPTCNPDSGSVFPIGNTTVTCTASDAANNVGTNSFVVSIVFVQQDSTPPSITVPADLIVQATSSSGAQVNYTVTATDDVGVTSGPTCNPSSGTIFPLGNTTVTCTASDADNNVGTNSFKVSVQDTVAPTITPPPDATVKATGNLTLVSLGSPVVHDQVDASPIVTNNATSGYPAGTTSIVWTATDFSGNSASAIQKVTVQKYSTALSINPVSNILWGKTITVSGLLTNSSGKGIANKSISFNGTGAINLPTVVTNSNGFFTSSAPAPNIVAAGLTFQAHFTGDAVYLGNGSAISSYTTLIHKSAIALTTKNVPWSKASSFIATLTDADNGGTPVQGATIHFDGTGVIGVPDVITNSTGKVTGVGTAPSTVGTGWTTQAHFAGNSLYVGKDSVIKTFSTITHKTVIALTTKNVPWSTASSFIATLTDADNGGTPVQGATIHFDGTGVIGVPDVITNSTGKVTGVGTAPSTVGTGWTTQAHFAGNSLYISTDLFGKTYNTLTHTTALALNTPGSAVVHGHTYAISGSLKDMSTGVLLASKTITFTVTTPPINNTITDSTGKYTVNGLVAPGIGSYNIQAKYAGDSLYASNNSAVKVLNVT